MRIPKKIHLIWIDTMPPDWLPSRLARWGELNPEYEVILHTNPEPIPTVYGGLRPQVRGDYLRMAILYKEGGVYYDCDVEPCDVEKELATYCANVDERLLAAGSYIGPRSIGDKDIPWIGHLACMAGCEALKLALEKIHSSIDIPPTRAFFEIRRDRPELFRYVPNFTIMNR